jgi:hypothetical protein
MSDPIPPTEQTCCAQCGNVFADADLLRFGQLTICSDCKPVYLQQLREGAVTGGQQWRSGLNLVVVNGVVLSNRCVKCNAPTTGAGLLRKLNWHSRVFYLLVLVNLLIYLLVALVARKRGKVTIHLCEPHLALRRRRIWLASGLFGVAVLLFGLGIANTSSNYVVYPFLGALLALLGSLIFVAKVGMVHARRIDRDYIWVRGVCPEYLAELPEWQGKK